MSSRADGRWAQLAAQLAVLAAIAMSAIIVYAIALSPSFQPGWLAVDLGIVALCLAVVRRQSGAVGFRSLGAHRHRTLFAIALGCLLVLASQEALPHFHELTIDENNYLAAVRHVGIDRQGLMPYNMRWLVLRVARRDVHVSGPAPRPVARATASRRARARVHPVGVPRRLCRE